MVRTLLSSRSIVTISTSMPAVEHTMRVRTVSCLTQVARPGPDTALETEAGKWQAAILKAEQNRPKLRVVTSD